jgi:hypothetical protein
MKNMSLRVRSVLVLGFFALSAVPAALAIDAVETADFPGGVSFATNPSIGTLEPGANTVSGSLNGNCVIGDCNGVAAGDTQDSLLFTVPAGYQVTSLTVTTSAVAGPTGFSLSMDLRSPTANIHFTPFLSPLPGTTDNLLAAPVSAGVYAISIFGQQASAAGAFSLNWSVAMNLAPVVESPSTAVSNLISQLSDPNLGLSHGQIASLTDKLNNVLGSIQAGLHKQATNQLNAFINSVSAAIKTNNMSLATGTTLIDEATAIIAML